MATYNQFKKINSEAIINGAVTGAKLANLAVTADKINNSAVATADIQDGAVGTTQISNTLDLSSKTVTYRSILNADVNATAAIAGSKLGSGAATTNLGYTPLNKAGGTMTGTLTVPAGSAAAASIASTSAAGTGIHFPSTNNLAITTGGTNRITFDASGRPQNGNQPAFYASGNGGWYYHNSFPSTSSPGGQWRELINGWSWQIAGQQGGSNFTSTGRFTAPVAGYYYFYAQSYQYNDANNSAGYTHWNIGRNGSIYGASATGRAPHTIYGHGVPSHYVPGIMVSITTYMNAGDYASVCPYIAPVARIHGDHSLFCGYLIG